MGQGTVPDERCGYTYDASALADLGSCSCWRPTWDDGERCVWHADATRKRREDLEAQAPDGPERLDGLALEAVDLSGTDWFEGCTLVGATFTAVALANASLAGADAREASLEEVDARGANLSDVNLENASVRVCDFRSADLQSAKFDQTVLSNARINRDTAFGHAIAYETEFDESVENERTVELAQAAIWSYREIQNLYETNALPYEARHYYLKEKDVRRRLSWHVGHYGRALMAEGSRWITGYGMSPWRVLGTAAVIIVASAFLYPTTGGLEETISRGDEQTTITWAIENPEATPQYVLLFVFFRSLYFSIVTFTSLGYGDISPVGDFARAVAGIEALLGQLLVALLVFVLSRRIS